jgi:probable rRNA maturation factor
MVIDILTEDSRWDALDLTRLAERALSETLVHLGLDAAQADVSILACNDARIAELNTTFRDKAGPTNVLSWPCEDLAPEDPGAAPDRPEPDPDGSLPLGDIALAYDTCAREAEALGKPMTEHVTHLVIHGVLHLLGYDHIRDPDATLMQTIEAEILGKLGYDDPYSI